jgi:hypothetical protein
MDVQLWDMDTHIKISLNFIMKSATNEPNTPEMKRHDFHHEIIMFGLKSESDISSDLILI